MKNLYKIILSILLTFVLSDLLAHYFGRFYGFFAPQALSGGWIGSRGSMEFLIGFPFAWILFIGLSFWTFVPKHYKGWIGWLTAPSFLLFGGGDLPHIYLPIALALLAWGIAIIIRKIFGITLPTPKALQ